MGPIYDLIHDLQVAVAPTFANKHGKCRPQMHRVWNQLQALDGKLSVRSSYGSVLDEILSGLRSAEKAALKGQFDSALDAAVTKLRKYTSKLLEFAKQARVFDPRQRGSLQSEVGMGKTLATYNKLFRSAEQNTDMKADWEAYWKLPVVQNVDGFKIREWWASMEPTLPKLAAVARRVLGVPATGVDVERSFSSLKWVRDERQASMQEATHRAAVLLHFNGLVGDWD